MQYIKSIFQASSWVALFVISAVASTFLIGGIGLALDSDYVTDGLVSCTLCLRNAQEGIGFDELIKYGYVNKASNFMMLILFVSYLPVLAAGAVSVYRRKKEIAWPKMRIMLACIALAAVVNAVLEVLIPFFEPLIPSEDSGMLEFAMSMLTGGTPYAIFVMTGILAPIVEELVYRAGVQKPLQKINPVFAILVSASIFGITHGNLVQGIFAGIFGLVLGYVYYKTDNLLYTIGMHIAVNQTGCAIMIFGLPEIPTYVAVAIIALVAFGLYELFRDKGKDTITEAAKDDSSESDETEVLPDAAPAPISVVQGQATPEAA